MADVEGEEVENVEEDIDSGDLDMSPSTCTSSVDTYLPQESFDPNCKLKKISLPEHIAAFINKKKLTRETEAVNCNQTLVDKVMLNYIIAKRILSNSSWQDKVICKQVCSTWHSAIHTLRKEQMSSVNFVMSAVRGLDWHNFEQSATIVNEPMAVLAFANIRGFNMSAPCGKINPCPCSKPCGDNQHNFLDIVYSQVSSPKNCLLTSVTQYISFMPLCEDSLSSFTIRRKSMFSLRYPPFTGGIAIPVIPDADFKVINMKHIDRNTAEIQKYFFTEIDKISQNNIIKGVIVYVTEKFLLQSVEDIVFLEYINKVQPDTPYALAGCIVEDTICDKNEINRMVQESEGYNYVTENFISIGVFTVPKITKNNDTNEKYNFDVFSLVIESTDWSKQSIQRTINEFATKVPQFEHTIALKLSCVGRDQKHDIEQEAFREAFPNTPIIGCYGNGELGINHPPRPPPVYNHRNPKRHKQVSSQGIMYSYSTVFMYIGWGK